jgi:hypothetical protein
MLATYSKHFVHQSDWLIPDCRIAASIAQRSSGISRTDTPGDLTRLSNGFSKKWENFEAAVALNFTYYNFCKRNIAVKTTSAKAAGLEDHEWTVAELVERCGE